VVEARANSLDQDGCLCGRLWLKMGHKWVIADDD
jgi:hypothetical protein